MTLAYLQVLAEHLLSRPTGDWSCCLFFDGVCFLVRRPPSNDPANCMRGLANMSIVSLERVDPRGLDLLVSMSAGRNLEKNSRHGTGLVTGAIAG